jgi:glycosyltransferase involved in cell wall biosynthesis
MGCAIVTTPQHGADGFIRDGVNGFLVPHNNVEYTTKIINHLVKDGFKMAVEMGKRARETAIKEFSIKRYREDWINLLTDLKVL